MTSSSRSAATSASESATESASASGSNVSTSESNVSTSESASASNAPRRLSSGGPYETRFGYSRALRTGDRILVSGCTSVVDGRVQHPGDAAAQMRVALDVALDAVTSLGGSAGDVVRTRMYVVDRGDCESVGIVHGERFAEVRPAATMVVVSGLIDEAMLVEVELEACLDTGQRAGLHSPDAPGSDTGVT